MNKKTLLILPIVSMALAGCGKSTSPTTDTTSTSSNPGTSVTRPDDGGHKSKDIASALEYDYSNVTLFTGVSYNDGANAEIDYEYYNDDHIVIYSPDVVETYGSDYMSLAFSEYYVVGDKCYTYWEPEKGNKESKGGWLTNGFYNQSLAIWKAYFYLPFLLEGVEASDFSRDIVGNYYITDLELNNQVIENAFSWVKYVDLGLDLPVDISFQVDNETGAFKKIMAFFDDGKNENSENYVLIQFGDIGSTVLPSYGDFRLHDAPNENNITTYWQYKGWEHDYQQAYYTALDVEVGSPSDEYVNVDSGKHEVTAKLDKKFGVNLFTTPEGFQPWDLVPMQNREIVFEYDHSILREDYSYDYTREFQTIKPGTTTIKAKVLGENVYIYSDEITVTVEAPETQNLEDAIYKFTWIGFTDPEDPYRIYASNDYANGLPCTIRAFENKGTKFLDGKNGDFTENGKNYLCFSPQQAVKPTGGPGDETYVLFDFDDQQVSELSFNFALFYGSQKSEFFKTFDSMTISTSNDGENWETIDITQTIKDELSTEFWKLCDVKFNPATMVRIDVKAWMCGGNGTLCLDSVAFSSDENCHAHGASDKVDVTGIMLSSQNLELEEDEEVKLTALVLPENATNRNVTWTSSDPTVVTVDANGNVKGISAGDATITATTVDGNFEATCNVNVYGHPVLPAEYAGTYECNERDATVVLDAEANTIHFVYDETDITLPLKKLENRTMTFSDGTNKITAEKDNDGLYFGTQGGTVIDGKSYVGSWTFTKMVEATNFDLRVSYATDLGNGQYGVRVGAHAIVTAVNFKPSEANVKDVVWTVENGTGTGSYDEEVSQFTGLTAGTVTLKATLNGKVVKSVTFVVSEPVIPTGITITGESQVAVGSTIKLTAVVSPIDADDKSVTWSSNQESVATVSSNGTVKGISPGLATITATSKVDNSVVGTFVVEVVAGSTSLIPLSMQGSYSFGIDDDGNVEEGGTIVINADGTAIITIDGVEVAFEFVSKSGKDYSYTGISEYVDAIVTFDGASIESLWVDDGNCVFYFGCELTFSVVTKD